MRRCTVVPDSRLRRRLALWVPLACNMRRKRKVRASDARHRRLSRNRAVLMTEGRITPRATPITASAGSTSGAATVTTTWSHHRPARESRPAVSVGQSAHYLAGAARRNATAMRPCLVDRRIVHRCQSSVYVCSLWRPGHRADCGQDTLCPCMLHVMALLIASVAFTRACTCKSLTGFGSNDWWL